MTSSSKSRSHGLAVHSIDEFVFSVPDLQQARHFYSAFGMDVRDESDSLALYTYGHPHRWARVTKGRTKRLLWVTFGIYAEDLQQFARHLGEQQTSPATAPDGADPGGLWLRGPDGVPLQLRGASKSSPSSPAPREHAPPCRNQGRSVGRSKITQVRPLYLSHILLFTADVAAASQFYLDVLGLRLSDRSGSAIAFLHSPHGSDDHLIALAKSSGPGLHHSSWCVPSIDAVGLGAQQMVLAGYEKGWGIGRHVLGSNYFRYVQDPWGSYAEYSYDIDFVDPGAQWPAADHPAEDSLYVWGPNVPADFVVNHELPNA
jgi:catechol 2,3-dioxygenase-like lactoylglutathione lyase family enzyme